MGWGEMANGKYFRWLVTGGAGFFGIHMCRGLVERGHEVTSYDIADFPDNEKIEGVRVASRRHRRDTISGRGQVMYKYARPRRSSGHHKNAG